jgi:hypothetical protein
VVAAFVLLAFSPVISPDGAAYAASRSKAKITIKVPSKIKQSTAQKMTIKVSSPKVKAKNLRGTVTVRLRLEDRLGVYDDQKTFKTWKVKLTKKHAGKVTITIPEMALPSPAFYGDYLKVTYAPSGSSKKKLKTTSKSKKLEIVQSDKYDHPLVEAIKTGNTFGATKNLKKIIDAARRAISEAGVTDSMTDAEKAKAISLWICGHMTYSDREYDKYNVDTYGDYCTVAEALLEGVGICVSYKVLTELLMLSVDVQAVEVEYSGDSPTDVHAWNMVRIDGQWYHLDTTWMDGDVSYDLWWDMFLASDSYFKGVHQQRWILKYKSYGAKKLPKSASVSYWDVEPSLYPPGYNFVFPKT